MNVIAASRVFLVILLAAFGVGVTGQSAQAHSANSYFDHGRWPITAGIEYGLSYGFPGAGEWRGRVYAGKEQWNAVANANDPHIYWSLPDDVSYGDARNPCGVPGLYKGAVFWNDLNYLSIYTTGVTRLCGAAPVVNFTIEFDSSRSDWYVGTGDAPSGTVDFWSVATHEFGHALGWWDHLPESDGACPDSGSRNTMCPTVYAGTERQRTVADHDIHTFNEAY